MTTRVSTFTEALLESYGRVGAINHLDGKNLPSKRVIGQIRRSPISMNPLTERPSP